MNVLVRSKIPLRWAAQTLSNLCDLVDNTTDLKEGLTQAFRGAGIDLAESIERRKATMWTVEGQLKAARGARAEIDAYVQRLKAIQAAVKDEAKEAMEAHPDLPWRDSMGRKLSLCNNQPSVDYCFDLKESRTFTNLIDHTTIDMFQIPAAYLQTATVTMLNTTAIKDALKAGADIMWAELKHGKHVRGLLPKEDEVDNGEG